MTEHIHVHVHLDGIKDHTVQLNRIETVMNSAATQLTALKAQLADTTADVLAKIDQLTTQMGGLTPEAQATLDDIKASITALDTTIGDADSSDTPPPVPQP